MSKKSLQQEIEKKIENESEKNKIKILLLIFFIAQMGLAILSIIYFGFWIFGSGIESPGLCSFILLVNSYIYYRMGIWIKMQLAQNIENSVNGISKIFDSISRGMRRSAKRMLLKNKAK